MNNMDIQKGIETLANLSKLAANVTDAKSAAKQTTEPKQDISSQPHTQTVEVKVGSEQDKKPTVIREKPETHVHNYFPENRELSERECQVREMQLKFEAEEKDKAREFELKKFELELKERERLEARADRFREEQKEENKKFWKRFLIGVGAVAGIGVGCACIDRYTSSWSSSSSRLGISAPTQVNIPVEGSVK